MYCQRSSRLTKRRSIRYRRLALGVVPVVWGWSTLALGPIEALIAQWVGFTWLWWADLRATSAGWGECTQDPARKASADTHATDVQPRGGTRSTAST